MNYATAEVSIGRKENFSFTKTLSIQTFLSKPEVKFREIQLINRLGDLRRP